MLQHEGALNVAWFFNSKDTQKLNKWKIPLYLFRNTCNSKAGCLK